MPFRANRRKISFDDWNLFNNWNIVQLLKGQLDYRNKVTLWGNSENSAVAQIKLAVA